MAAAEDRTRLKTAPVNAYVLQVNAPRSLPAQENAALIQLAREL
jgi:hypothetical protein